MKRKIKKIVIIKAILLMMIVLITTACSGKRYKPQQEQTQKQESIQSILQKEKTLLKYTLPKMAPSKIEVKLYNQVLTVDMLEEAKFIKFYPSQKVQVRRTKPLSLYAWKEVPREIHKDTLYFRKTKSKRFKIPYYAVTFEEPVIIKSVLIYHTEEAYNDKNKKINIEPTFYMLKDKKKMKTQYVFSTRWNSSRIEKWLDIDGKTKIDRLLYESEKPHKQLFIAFDDLQGCDKTSFITIKNTPTIKVEGYSISRVVLETLKIRKDKNYNEELVREVGFKNSKLFRKIQKQAKHLNLPKSSIANLPIDVSIKYALKHHAKILKTGRYLTYNGKYKHIKTSFVFDSSYKYNSKHQVKVIGKKVKLKETTYTPKETEFIDFSKGL